MTEKSYKMVFLIVILLLSLFLIVVASKLDNRVAEIMAVGGFIMLLSVILLTFVKGEDDMKTATEDLIERLELMEDGSQ